MRRGGHYWMVRHRRQAGSHAVSVQRSISSSTTTGR
jgi:hypothetical protein